MQKKSFCALTYKNTGFDVDMTCHHKYFDLIYFTETETTLILKTKRKL